MGNTLENLSVIELAQNIQKRPRMWLPGVSLTLLSNLLLGFGINARKDSVPPFHIFRDFVGFKLNNTLSGMGYVHCILEHCGSNEEAAFHKFYELLDEYMLMQPRAIYTANLNEANFALYYSAEHESKPYRITDINTFQKTLLPAPYHIKLVDFGFATYVYYYDFYYITKDAQNGTLNERYRNLDEAKAREAKLYGTLEWVAVSDDNIMCEFESIVRNQK